MFYVQIVRNPRLRSTGTCQIFYVILAVPPPGEYNAKGMVWYCLVVNGYCFVDTKISSKHRNLNYIATIIIFM